MLLLGSPPAYMHQHLRCQYWTPTPPLCCLRTGPGFHLPEQKAHGLSEGYCGCPHMYRWTMPPCWRSPTGSSSCRPGMHRTHQMSGFTPQARLLCQREIHLVLAQSMSHIFKAFWNSYAAVPGLGEAQRVHRTTKFPSSCRMAVLSPLLESSLSSATIVSPACSHRST
jgi:hypothetical protein